MELTGSESEAACDVPNLNEAASYALHLTDSVNKWLSPLPENVKQDENEMDFSASSLPGSDEVQFAQNQEEKTKKSHTDKKRIFTFNLQSYHIVKKKQGTSKMYRCDICNATYRHVFSLKRHFLRNHVTIKYISSSDISNCKINVFNDSDKSDDSYTDLTVKKRHYSDESESQNNESTVLMPGLYRCHLCRGKTFDLKAELKEHYEMHPDSSRSRFPCKECGNSFSHKQTLFRHMAKHSGTSFYCKSCDLSFDSKASYGKHCASHTSNRTCKYCNKVLSTSANKRRHERIHEGLKPYPCRYCDAQFSQSGELKKHLKVKHHEFCVSCPVCDARLSSKVALKKHLIDKHKNVKAAPIKNGIARVSPTPLPLPKSKEDINKMPIVAKKVFNCPVCKKSFNNYVNMLRHRRQVHPFLQGKRKVHKRQIKVSKSSIEKKFFCTRSSPRTPPITDDQFYSTLSQKIADNLINHVDGKTSHLSLVGYNFVDQNEPVTLPPLESWSSYNFPATFNVDEVLCNGQQQEIKSKSFQETSQINCQSSFVHNSFSFAGDPYSSDLSDVNKSYCDSSMYYSDSDFSDSENFYFNSNCYVDYRNLNIEERKKLIGREIKAAYLCCVCKERFLSVQTFDDHSINNHPNVVCTYIEIEGDEEKPPVVPPDLCWQYLSPIGVYCSYNVPPPTSDLPNVRCTKCKASFVSFTALHEHIISCGNKEIAAKFVKKVNHQRRIKHTMKNRMDTALKPNFVKSHKRNGSYSPMPVTTTEPKRFKKGQLIAEEIKEKKKQFESNVFNCLNCKLSFKTKSMLNSHKCKSYKKFKKGKKIRIASLQLPHASNTSLNNSTGSGVKTASKISLAGNYIVDSAKTIESIDDTSNLLKIEAKKSKDRLSPSLEHIVNSIKQKINSEELSPPQPSLPWMDDEHLEITSSPEKMAGFILPNNQNKIGESSVAINKEANFVSAEVSNEDENCAIVKIVSEVNLTSDSSISKEVRLACENLDSGSVKPVSDSFDSEKVELASDRLDSEKAKLVSDSFNSEKVNLLDCDISQVMETIDNDNEVVSAIDVEINSFVVQPSVAEVEKQSESCNENIVLSTSAPDSHEAKSADTLECVAVDLVVSNQVSENNTESVEISLMELKEADASSTSEATNSVVTEKISPEVMTAESNSYKLADEKPSIKSESLKNKHKCPYCTLEFAYLNNFRRHISACLERKERKKEQETPSPGSQVMLYLPKKDEVEGSLLNLIRHQSRQSQIMKEVAGNIPSSEVKRFQTYTCETCHRIFFSLFQLLKHNVVHKLKNTEEKGAVQTVVSNIGSGEQSAPVNSPTSGSSRTNSPTPVQSFSALHESNIAKPVQTDSAFSENADKPSTNKSALSENITNKLSSSKRSTDEVVLNKEANTSTLNKNPNKSSLTDCAVVKNNVEKVNNSDFSDSKDSNDNSSKPSLKNNDIVKDKSAGSKRKMSITKKTKVAKNDIEQSVSSIVKSSPSVSKSVSNGQALEYNITANSDIELQGGDLKPSELNVSEVKSSLVKGAFPCPYCDRVLSSFKYRKRHIEVKHKEESVAKPLKKVGRIAKKVIAKKIMKTNRHVYQRQCRKPVGKISINMGESKRGGFGKKKK